MNEPWSQYLRLGINHHLLFPDSFESIAVHRRSLPEVLGYPEFEVIDMFLANDMEAGIEEAELVKSSTKEPIYNCPLMMSPTRNPHSPDPVIRRETQDEVIAHLLRARSIGARKAVIASGVNPGESLFAEQTAYFVDYVYALCQAVPDMEVLIEPFDRSIGKNLLIGSTREAADVIRQVRERGPHNAGLLIDMGHIPLMGETFEGALQEAKPYVRHIHLGSCVMSNPTNPLYGDMHPPWGYADGENDVPELIEFLRELFRIGYLGGESKPTVTLEMRPYPGKSERQSVDIFLSKLDEAWRAL
ncbi:sugar phosphate isomerase/epimerase family protein [Paenibacillus sp. strain BS8-2]